VKTPHCQLETREIGVKKTLSVRWKNKIGDYWILTKPRITFMVILTAAIGCYLATTGKLDLKIVFHTVCGTALLAAGTAVLNQVMEKEADGRMKRTARRPLPSGKVTSLEALLFGLLLVLSGTTWLLVVTNPLTALLGWLTSVIYLVLYTPLKKYSAFCTAIGAIPGAVPPLMGWAAVRGDLNLDSLLLFLLLFSWQFPHFLAIALLYREDYLRGGFKMLPTNDTSGSKTRYRILVSTLALVVVSLLLAWSDFMGMLYLFGSLVLGFGLIWVSYKLFKNPTKTSARYLLKASVVYLPLMLVLMVIDRA
jgi:protoheme IX farnesyltransferase